MQSHIKAAYDGDSFIMAAEHVKYQSKQVTNQALFTHFYFDMSGMSFRLQV